MELQYAAICCLHQALVPFFCKICNAAAQRTYSLTVAMMAGDSLVVITTEMLASYVVSGTEDSLADCRHDGWGITGCNHNRDAGVICGKWYR